MNEQTSPVQSVWWFPLKSWKLHEEKGKKLTLAWMRGEAWIAHCLKVAGLKAAAGLPDVVAGQVVINDDSFRAYKSGRDRPLIGSVEAINKVLPGTLQTWEVGPDGLPLWAILDDDLSASHALVDDELANHAERAKWSLLSDRNCTIRDMNPLQKAQALLENTVPWYFWSRTYWERQSMPVVGWAGRSSVEELEDEDAAKKFTYFRHQDRNTYYLTLEEFISHNPSVLANVYTEGARRLKLIELGEQTEQGDETKETKAIKANARRARIGFSDFRYITSPRRVLSLLALYRVLNSGTDVFAKDVADYLMGGIDQAVSDLFGSAVHKFVGENF